ncbi:MAG: hypothetical protein HY320_06705 [Armatimonadetes bacterium]|nr:hypothetical protein [Armatimonadota bacterium]
MDGETLFRMAKAAARGADRIAASPPPSSLFDTVTLAYVGEYNRLVPFVIALYGEEARRLFQQIEVPDVSGGVGLGGPLQSLQRMYNDWASARLNSLAAYLEGKVGAHEAQLQALVDLIEANLRPSIFEDPTCERDVQNTLEVILRARGLVFQRERVAIPYSSKKFIPDFLFETLELALEVKLCISLAKEKALVEEINADIPAYQSRYRTVIFVVYDLGFIRDVAQFRSGIEGNAGVRVLVVKK